MEVAESVFAARLSWYLILFLEMASVSHVTEPPTRAAGKGS